VRTPHVRFFPSPELQGPAFSCVLSLSERRSSFAQGEGRFFFLFPLPRSQHLYFHSAIAFLFKSGMSLFSSSEDGMARSPPPFSGRLSEHKETQAGDPKKILPGFLSLFLERWLRVKGPPCILPLDTPEFHSMEDHVVLQKVAFFVPLHERGPGIWNCRLHRRVRCLFFFSLPATAVLRPSSSGPEGL